MTKVTCHSAEGMNFSWNLNIFSGPLFTISCGKCYHKFEHRLPKHNNPEIICPACRTVNIVPATYG